MAEVEAVVVFRFPYRLRCLLPHQPQRCNLLERFNLLERLNLLNQLKLLHLRQWSRAGS